VLPLLACFLTAAAAPAGKPAKPPAGPQVRSENPPPAPPDGTYTYAVARNGTDQGTVSVTLLRRAGVFETDEVAVVGAARAHILGAYRFSDLGPDSYTATYQAPFPHDGNFLGREDEFRPHVSFNTQTTVRYSVDAEGAQATIDGTHAADVIPVPAATPGQVRPKAVILDGPFMTGWIMLPAMRHHTSAINVRPVSEGFPFDAGVVTARIVRAVPKDPKTPKRDVSLELPGLATLWYDPHSFIVHEVYLEALNLDERLVAVVKPAVIPNFESAPAPAPLPTLLGEEVTFESGDATPAGVRNNPLGAKRPFPAVLLVAPPVPDPPTRNFGGHGPDPMFPALARALVQRGYAVLRYDERGLGKSTGSYQTATWEQTFDDVTAALESLVATPGVDVKHIFVLGYDTGADLALVAAGPGTGVAGAVALGPSVIPYRVAFERETLAGAKTAQDRKKARDQLRRAAAALGKIGAQVGVEGHEILANDGSWVKTSFAHDPTALALRATVPLFVLHSGLYSSAKTSADVKAYDDRLRAANPRATVIVANDLTERFGGRYDADSPGDGEAIFPYHIDPSTVGAIVDWLDAVRMGLPAAPGPPKTRFTPLPPSLNYRPTPPPPPPGGPSGLPPKEQGAPAPAQAPPLPGQAVIPIGASLPAPPQQPAPTPLPPTPAPLPAPQTPHA
jgi:alpha/beta superfamily hydrolase